MGVVAMRITSRVITFAMVMTLAAGAVAAPPAAIAAGVTPSQTTLGAPSLDPKPVGLTSDITATVTSGATGDVQFFDNDVLVATVALNGSSQAVYTVPGDATPGLHAITAEYTGDATYAESEDSRNVTVGARPVTVVLGLKGPHDASGASAHRGDTLTATVAITDDGTTGSLDVSGGTVRITVGGVVKETITLPATGASLSTATWAPGTRTLRAVYDPGTATDHEAGASAAVSVVVAMGSATTQYTKFYPFRDGYRDAVALRGVRYQSESVAIKVISPAGKTVKTASVARATGSWSVQWNGRNSAGKMLGAGKYTVKQTVADARGVKQTFTSYVTLSAKRLYTYTRTFTQNTDQIDYAGSGWAGWQFALPAATVYKKVVFAVNAKSNRPVGRFGPQDYTKCTAAFVGPACASPTASLPTARAWKSITGSVTRNRSGTKVRLYIWKNSGSVWVWNGRVTVTYGVLR